MKSKLLIKPTFIAFIVFVLSSCTNEHDFRKGRKQLEQQGYTNIKSTGYAFFCCGEDDDFKEGFTAIDKDGNRVNGCICSGFMKGITVRFE